MAGLSTLRFLFNKDGTFYNSVELCFQRSAKLVTLLLTLDLLQLVFHSPESILCIFPLPLFHNNILLLKWQNVRSMNLNPHFPCIFTNTCSMWLKPICYSVNVFLFWRTINDNDTFANNVDNYKIRSISVPCLHKKREKGFLSLLDLLLKLFCEGEKSPLKTVSILLSCFLTKRDFLK